MTGMKGLGTQDCAIQESMGPIADRTREYLLATDTAIVKIRRLLLQALDNHAAGKPLPGTKPESYRVRSTRFEAPKGAKVVDGMLERVRAAAELVFSDTARFVRVLPVRLD